MKYITEEGDVSSDTVDSWQEGVLELTQGYALEDVWKKDETGSFWKVLPAEKSLSEKGKCCCSGKHYMQRIMAAFFVKGALGLTKQSVQFADWSGEEQLSLAAGCVYDLLCDICDSEPNSLKQLSLVSPKSEAHLFASTVV